MNPRWPLIQAEDLTGARPIIVLAPHPDDESLGCGALLTHAFAHQGAHVICLSDGSASHPGSRAWPGARLAQQRHSELESALAHLGGGPQDLSWFGLQDGALHSYDAAAIAARICEITTALGAGHLFAPAQEDHHADHKAAAHIARLVARLQPGLRLFTYPIWSRWDEPDFEALIADYRPMRLCPGPHRDAKRAAINAHASQLGQLVEDDPNGFIMEQGFVERFVSEDEIFWSSQP